MSKGWLKMFAADTVKFPKIQGIEQIMDDGFNPVGHLLVGQQGDQV